MTPANRPSKHPHHQAYTLLEMLVVLAIVVILFSLAVPAFQRMIEGQAPGAAANEFASLLRSARQYAMDNNVRTRVVFADDLLEQSEGGRLKAGSYGAYYFYVPRQPQSAAGLHPVRFGDTTMLEFAPMPWLSIPSGFVGQWIPLPIAPRWRELSERVELTSELFEQPNTKAFFDSHYFVPPKYWDPRGINFYEQNIMSAVFPRNYYQTPYPTSYPRRTTNLPPDERILAGVNLGKNYKELWPQNHPYSYFHDIDQHLGDVSQLGTPESGTADRRFFDLHGIEYDSEGRPVFQWTEELVFRFAHTQNPDNFYTVSVSRASGLPQVD